MVASKQHLFQTIVQFDKPKYYPENLQQEEYMTTIFATAPLWVCYLRY